MYIYPFDICDVVLNLWVYIFLVCLHYFALITGCQVNGDGLFQSGRTGGPAGIQQRHQHGNQLPATALRDFGLGRKERKQENGHREWEKESVQAPCQAENTEGRESENSLRCDFKPAKMEAHGDASLGLGDTVAAKEKAALTVATYWVLEEVSKTRRGKRGN